MCLRHKLGVPSDLVPNAFSFIDATEVQLSTSTSSNVITITGISGPAPVSCSGIQFMIIGVTGWVGSGTILNGQQIQIKRGSAATTGTTVSGTLTIGGVSTTWNVTTLVSVDTTPNSYSWTAQSDVVASTVTDSNFVTISGINTPAPVTITGGTFSIGGAGWTTSGNITNGQTLQVRVTSSGSSGGVVSATTTVGGVQSTFSVTTHVVPAVTYYLNWMGTNGSGNGGGSYVSQDTIFGSTSGDTALATGLQIPKDGNWYYWEAYSDAVNGQSAMGVGTQTAVQYSAGQTGSSVANWDTDVASSNLAAHVRGLYARWNSATGYFLVGGIRPSGVNSGVVTFPTTTLYMYPLVKTAGTPHWTKLVVRASEMKFNPSGLVASLYPAIPAYNAYPTYALVAG